MDLDDLDFAELDNFPSPQPQPELNILPFQPNYLNNHNTTKHEGFEAECKLVFRDGSLFITVEKDDGKIYFCGRPLRIGLETEVKVNQTVGFGIDPDAPSCSTGPIRHKIVLQSHPIASEEYYRKLEQEDKSQEEVVVIDSPIHDIDVEQLTIPSQTDTVRGGQDQTTCCKLQNKGCEEKEDIAIVYECLIPLKPRQQSRIKSLNTSHPVELVDLEVELRQQLFPQISGIHAAPVVLRNPLLLFIIFDYLPTSQLKRNRLVNSQWKQVAQKRFVTNTIVRLNCSAKLNINIHGKTGWGETRFTNYFQEFASHGHQNFDINFVQTSPKARLMFEQHISSFCIGYLHKITQLTLTLRLRKAESWHLFASLLTNLKLLEELDLDLQLHMHHSHSDSNLWLGGTVLPTVKRFNLIYTTFRQAGDNATQITQERLQSFAIRLMYLCPNSEIRGFKSIDPGNSMELACLQHLHDIYLEKNEEYLKVFLKFGGLRLTLRSSELTSALAIFPKVLKRMELWDFDCKLVTPETLQWILEEHSLTLEHFSIKYKKCDGTCGKLAMPSCPKLKSLGIQSNYVKKGEGGVAGGDVLYLKRILGRGPVGLKCQFPFLTCLRLIVPFSENAYDEFLPTFSSFQFPQLRRVEFSKDFNAEGVISRDTPWWISNVVRMFPTAFPQYDKIMKCRDYFHCSSCPAYS